MHTSNIGIRRRQWHPIPVLLPGKSDTTERLHFHFSLSCIGEGNGNLLQCSCLENPRDGGAWWAAFYGVTQSRTWLKWLSSIVDLQYCVSFCCTENWFSYSYRYIHPVSGSFLIQVIREYWVELTMLYNRFLQISMLYLVVYICWPQTPNLSFFSKFLSIAVFLFYWSVPQTSFLSQISSYLALCSIANGTTRDISKARIFFPKGISLFYFTSVF